MTHEITSAAQIVALFETNKDQRKSFVDSLVNEIAEGGRNPLEIHTQIKAMEDIAKELNSRPEFKEAVLNEAQKSGKSFMFHNAKIDIKEVGTKYDFSICQDSELDSLIAESEKLAEKIKQRQALLKALPISGMADPISGEMLYPPSKSSTTAVAVTLK